MKVISVLATLLAVSYAAPLATREASAVPEPRVHAITARSIGGSLSDFARRSMCLRIHGCKRDIEELVVKREPEPRNGATICSVGDRTDHVHGCKRDVEELVVKREPEPKNGATICSISDRTNHIHGC